MSNSPVTKANPHDSAALYVTGKAQFLDDLPFPSDGLHVALGLSTIAYGDILSCDLEAVRSAEGVVAVLTADDIPGRNDASPVFGDDPIFVENSVSYHGQTIFAVIAKTAKQARQATLLANISYDEKTPIITIEDAFEHHSFLQAPRICKTGDAKAALARAPHRLTGELKVGGQEHFYLEGQAALAMPSENDEFVIHSSTQHPTEIQHKIAEALNLPFAAITVQVRRMGGGFGGKESQANLPAIIAALAAYKTKRTVKLVYDRDEDMRVTGKRHDARIRYEVGFDDEGHLLALDIHQDLRCGMSYDLSVAIADRSMTHADNAYYLKDITITSHLCKTNTPSNTAFRGFGGPQGMAGMERIIDEVAFALNCDPFIIRQRNFYKDHSMLSEGELQKTPYGQPVRDCIVQELTQTLAKQAHYQTRRKEIEAYNQANPMIRRGIALTPVKFGISFNKTMLNQAGALVHVYTDGSVHLNHGGTEMGQGLYTKVAQICAYEFGIDVSHIRLSAANTGKVPNTSATAASSGTDLNGMAAAKAARTIKDRMTTYLAQLYQSTSENIQFKNDQVHIGDEIISFAKAAQLCWQGRISLSSTGFYATPDIFWDAELMQGEPYYYYAYGAAVTEVAFDRLTGEARILQTDILHDVGHSVNPAIDRGQIEGGFVQGLGWLTTEELVYGKNGKLLTHAPSTYKIPACSDRPLSFNVRFFESGGNQAETIHRSKAVGEPPFMLSLSVLSAFVDAMRGTASHFPAINAPATAETLLTSFNASC